MFALPALPAVLGLPAVAAFLLSLALTIPFGWIYAFYQNVTVLGDGSLPSTGAVFSRALRHTLRQPGQNHAGLTVLSVLAIFAWLNLMALAFGLPQLAHMFTGEENLFTRSGVHYLFNTTFFGVTGALVYLALDPLAKTFYVLRCFYADSLRTGEDLKSELAALPPPAAVGKAAVLALGLVLFTARPHVHAAVRAATPPPAPAAVAPASPDSVSPPQLGRAIASVLDRREFAWRAPHKAGDAKAGGVDSMFDRMNRWWTERQTALGNWLDHWLGRFFKSRRNQNDLPSESRSSGLDAGTVRLLAYVVIAGLAGALVFLAWQHLHGTRLVVEGKDASAPAGPTPDLSDETVLASQLPEDEWLRLATTLLAGGDRRLALRALYLSVLAGLDERGLLAIARHKSNRDYQLELRRRARDQPERQGAFARNVGRFERVWYGRHDADDGLLADFQLDRQRVLG